MLRVLLPIGLLLVVIVAGAVVGVAVKDGAVNLERTLPGESVSLYEVSW